MIEIYASGKCNRNNKNDNVGVWVAVLVVDKKYKTFIGTEINTTTNRIQLRAYLEALKKLKGKKYSLKVYPPSNYILNGICDWIYEWIENDWLTAKQEPVKNSDLWKELFQVLEDYTDVTYELIGDEYITKHLTKTIAERIDHIEKMDNNLC